MIRAQKIRLHPTLEQMNCQNILRETLRLIGIVDQVASGIGSDEGVNLAVDAG